MDSSRHFGYTLPCLIVGLIFSVLCSISPMRDAFASQRQLEQKTADILLLKNQLEDRKRQAASVLQALSEFREELMNETRVIAKSYRVNTVDAALHQSRLSKNITLMQQIRAYEIAFRDKIRFYQEGEDKLGYLHDMVQDDLKMAATMRHHRIDALTTQISLLINRYINHAHIITIDQDNMDAVSADQVWRYIMAK